MMIRMRHASWRRYASPISIFAAACRAFFRCCYACRRRLADARDVLLMIGAACEAWYAACTEIALRCAAMRAMRAAQALRSKSRRARSVMRDGALFEMLRR